MIRGEAEVLADSLLLRAALTARLGWDRAPSPMAGYTVSDEEVDALLAGLPGLDREIPSTVPDDVHELLVDAEAAVDGARRRFAASLEAEGRFAALCRSAALPPDAAEVLALVLAVDGDLRRQRLVGYLADDIGLRRLTHWTLQVVCGPDALAAVAPSGPLRRACLLLPCGNGAWAAETVAPAPTVAWWLTGAEGLGPDLPPGLEPFDTGLAPDGQLQLPAPLVLSAGGDRTRRLQAVAAAIERSSMLVSQPPATTEQWEALVRSASLHGAALVLEVDSTLPAEVRDRIDRSPHVAWGVLSAHELPLGDLPRRPWTEVEPEPAIVDAEEWAGAFGGEAPAGAAAFRLSAEQLRQVRRVFPAVGEDLTSAVRRLGGAVSGTAERVRPRRSWTDLILDDDRASRVREVAIRCRQRTRVFDEWGLAPQPSTGVIALFAGPSGTGKTLAAEVIASEVGVDLLKVDLANMVSKYIGETEKNLSGVFDAAEASNVALFFDEADSLLGKRSEVSDAHDRYANIEVAYLLQRLERYDGLAIMATNLLRNIDTAFLRRIHVIVEFAVPEAAERRRIWRHCLPPRAPLADDLDLDRVADGVEIAGGAIRNAMATAAFLAAEEGAPIGNRQVEAALLREMQKLGRLFDVASLDGGR